MLYLASKERSSSKIRTFFSPFFVQLKSVLFNLLCVLDLNFTNTPKKIFDLFLVRIFFRSFEGRKRKKPAVRAIGCTAWRCYCHFSSTSFFSSPFSSPASKRFHQNANRSGSLRSFICFFSFPFFSYFSINLRVFRAFPSSFHSGFVFDCLSVCLAV